jgi:hypothetical protein
MKTEATRRKYHRRLHYISSHIGCLITCYRSVFPKACIPDKQHPYLWGTWQKFELLDFNLNVLNWKFWGWGPVACENQYPQIAYFFLEQIPSLVHWVSISQLNNMAPGLSKVSHTCNPSYLGGGDLEDLLRLAWTKRLQDPISTNGWVWWLIPVIPATQGSTHEDG